MRNIFSFPDNYRGFGGVRKWATLINSSPLGNVFAYRLLRAFPYIASSPNTFSWMWNRFRDPARYREYADNRKWAFIMGCTNSGTTLLHHLMASHPDMATLPLEGQFLSAALTHPYFKGYPRIWTEELERYRMTEADLRSDSVRLIHDLKNYLDNVNASTVLEKTPFNSIRSRWLQGLFKNSYFIGIARDGRAVAEGISRRNGGRDIKIERSAAHWVKNNAVMLDDAKHLRNFQLVRYEELVENPQETVSDLFKFIGLDPAKCQFNFQSDLHIRNIDGGPAPITNFNQKSFDRIPPGQFKTLTAQTQPMMRRLGYREIDSRWTTLPQAEVEKNRLWD